ncbi:hypothetical protein M3N64_07560 [Sporolactobacillus sp. CPB3-1]|uniref:Uncharacterized protein n=1 Tax=Sporolactobacillus mangiferae TaxID=2940498 RepID=A0ABT0MAC0_9BACL|nr:hypothetical protein [Sporolactobacillus mangiferae]MCL1631805.1 hypothetical protein [Sporolactobacillus mangiferae]
MSFVSIIVTERWISAVSDDKLYTVSKQDGISKRLGSKPSFVRLSERQFLACTGDANTLQIIKNELPFKKQSYVIDEARLDWMERQIKKVPSSQQDVLLAVADTTVGSTCRMIDNQPNSEWVNTLPVRGRAGTLFLAGKNIDEHHIKWIAEQCSQMIHGYPDDREHVIMAQVRLNRMAQKIDPSIGSRVFHMWIKAD